MNPFKESFQSQLTVFDHFLQNWINNYKKKIPLESKILVDAFEYALSGGKRFRPLLAILTAKVFKKDIQCVLPYACAIEFLHTYSLIHDDLPAMDNASKRRGRPSLHKAFDEATAILTGDALLTEAFELAICHTANDQNISSLIGLLVQAVGGRGMISGQIMDLQTINKHDHPLNLEWFYSLKTGALISASVVGVAILLEVQESSSLALKKIAQKLGIAFQIADDIEDFEQDKLKAKTVNCVYQWGFKKAKERLDALSKQALDILISITGTEDLQKLVQWNLRRIL